MSKTGAMLKYVLVLTLLTVCHSQDSEETEEPEEMELPQLPTPRLTYITTFDPAGFTVEWAPVESNEKNPVAGFNAKVWENEKELLFSPEQLEGIGNVWTKLYRPIEKPLDEIPETDPLVQTVGANETKARFENVKLKEAYQIRVQAVNDYGEEGPYSNVLGLKIGAE